MRYAFADCLLDTDTRTLLRLGTSVPVEPQVFDLLALLAANPVRVVTTDEIVEQVWRGRIVSDSTISARIAAARKAVGDSGKDQAVIRTVSRRGLQLIAPVNAPDAAPEPRASATQTVRYATASDGARIAYAVAGSGPPLLIGFYMGTDLDIDWNAPTNRPLYDALIPHHTVIRLDARGTGLSDRGIEEVDFARNATDILSVADAIGLDRFALLAESGGCLDTITFAATYPDRVSHLILAGGYAEGRSLREGGKPPESDSIRAIIDEGWGKPDNAFATGFATLYFPEGPHDAVRVIAENMGKSVSRETIILYRDAVNTASVIDLLPAIQAPTLIVHGRNDHVHPLSEARKLARGIKNAELLVLESANNIPIPGHPTFPTYVDAILAFLSRS